VNCGDKINPTEISGWIPIGGSGGGGNISVIPSIVRIIHPVSWNVCINIHEISRSVQDLFVNRPLASLRNNDGKSIKQ